MISLACCRRLLRSTNAASDIVITTVRIMNATRISTREKPRWWRMGASSHVECGDGESPLCNLWALSAPNMEKRQLAVAALHSELVEDFHAIDLEVLHCRDEGWPGTASEPGRRAPRIVLRIRNKTMVNGVLMRVAQPRQPRAFVGELCVPVLEPHLPAFGDIASI